MLYNSSRRLSVYRFFSFLFHWTTVNDMEKKKVDKIIRDSLGPDLAFHGIDAGMGPPAKGCLCGLSYSSIKGD